MTDWEVLVDAVQLPNRDDRHVVAAARGRADVIVTDNLADFPADALRTSLTRQSLDEFLLDSLNLYPAEVIRAVHEVAERMSK